MPVLQFKGKTAIENYHHTVAHHTLDFDAKLSVLGKDEKPSLEGNLIIEGDNLLALKALLPTHAGKIKCIYIDPPYNTGDEDWVFNDNLTQPQFKEWIGQTVGKEGEDATRHDKWCCTMYPRLALLKQLLNDDGAIFISIDDNEYQNLRMLMDEVFGEENFVATIIWQKKYSRDNRPPIGTVHDYIVAYCNAGKERFKEVRNKIPAEEESLAVYRNPNHDPKGRWRPVPLTAQAGHATPDQFYEIVTPTGKVHRPPAGRCWGITEPEYKKLLLEGTSIGVSKRGRIWFGNKGNSQPNLIRYLSEVEGFVPWTWWPHDEVGNTDESKKEILEIFGYDAFPSPKPTRLIKRIIEMYTNPDSNDMVLDSFAGSGTTAHAVLALNAEDEGNRNFIVIQIPFDTKDNQKQGLNICQKVTAERVSRVINGYPYKGVKEEVLFSRNLTLSALRGAQEILEEIDITKKAQETRFDQIVTEADGGKVRLIGKKNVGAKTDGLPGSFTYSRLGPALFGEYRDMGEKLPAYEELARYIFYTETSHEFYRKTMNEKTGKIGEHAGTSYYLLYTPEGNHDRAMDLPWLTGLGKTEKNHQLVVYCEKIWIHRDDLAKYEAESGRKVRPMLVPFNLK